MKKTWFPEPSQFEVVEAKDNNYLYSVWVGLTMPLIHLPQLLWDSVFRNLFAAVIGLGEVVIAVLMAVYVGFCGRAAGIRKE